MVAAALFMYPISKPWHFPISCRIVSPETSRVGIANETVAGTDIASQALNMMSFVYNLKATSSSVRRTVRDEAWVASGLSSWSACVFWDSLPQFRQLLQREWKWYTPGLSLPAWRCHVSIVLLHDGQMDQRQTFFYHSHRLSLPEWFPSRWLAIWLRSEYHVKIWPSFLGMNASSFSIRSWLSLKECPFLSQSCFLVRALIVGFDGDTLLNIFSLFWGGVTFSGKCQWAATNDWESSSREPRFLLSLYSSTKSRGARYWGDQSSPI